MQLYDEVDIIEVEIKTRSDGWERLYGLAKTIFQAIPHPILLVLRYKHYVRLFTAKFETGKKNANKNIANNCHATDWIDVESQWLLDDFITEQIVDSVNKAKSMEELYRQWTDIVRVHASISMKVRNMYVQKISEDYAQSLLLDSQCGYVPQEWLDEFFTRVPIKNNDDDDVGLTIPY